MAVIYYFHRIFGGYRIMDLSADFWILRPFNTVFNAVFALFLILLITASLLLKGKSEKAKQTVLVTACLITLVGFFIYKYALSLDSDYNIIKAEFGGFNWWGELPLHMCNINMILIPIAVLKKNRSIMCFCFFCAPLGGLMALAMPGTGFSGYSIFLPRMLGYFGTHFMIVMEGLALVTFGLYRPRYRDLPRTLLAAVLIMVCLFGFNMLLRLTGVYANANYFYTVETEGNFLLEIFYRWIPYPLLYQAPSVAILGIYMLLVTTPFELTAHKHEKVEQVSGSTDG